MKPQRPKTPRKTATPEQLKRWFDASKAYEEALQKWEDWLTNREAVLNNWKNELEEWEEELDEREENLEDGVPTIRYTDHRADSHPCTCPKCCMQHGCQPDTCEDDCEVCERLEEEAEAAWESETWFCNLCMTNHIGDVTPTFPCWPQRQGLAIDGRARNAGLMKPQAQVETVQGIKAEIDWLEDLYKLPDRRRKKK